MQINEKSYKNQQTYRKSKTTRWKLGRKNERLGTLIITAYRLLLKIEEWTLN